jgi:Uma2 family endonuclease
LRVATEPALFQTFQVDSKLTEQEQVAASDKRYTYQEALAEFPESNRPQEISDGKFIVAPVPRFEHQQVVARLQRIFADWVTGRDLGWVVFSPIDMVLSPHRAVQPDIVFVGKERRGIIRGAIYGPADLVVEVISLGSRDMDQINKRDLYSQHGIREYWLVDPESESLDVLWLERFSYEVTMRCKRGEVAKSTLLAGLQVDVSTLFDGLLR